MAGDWIKFEHATLDKPEVLVMADMLETTPDDVIGKLLRVWVWFDKQSRDGYAGGVTGNALMFFIDRHVARNGFAACMKKVGWLGDDCLPNFDRHNGETAKNRALSKDRMKRKRYADVTPEASPEKRREEKKQIPLASRDSRASQKVTWTEAGFQIPDSVMAGFKTAYPAAQVEAEIAKAHAWALANPKNRKSQWGRFLNGWLQRAQDRARPVKGDEKRFVI